MAKTPLQAAAQDYGHHIVPTIVYVRTLVLLAILMLLTIWAASINIRDVGPISGTIMNQTVALVIAAIKASLVVWIFMGVGSGTHLTKMWAATGFVWFTLLGLILIDYPMRAFEATQGWEAMPGQQQGRGGLPDQGSALPRVVPPSGERQPIDPNEVNLRPRQ